MNGGRQGAVSQSNLSGDANAPGMGLVIGWARISIHSRDVYLLGCVDGSVPRLMIGSLLTVELIHYVLLGGIGLNTLGRREKFWPIGTKHGLGVYKRRPGGPESFISPPKSSLVMVGEGSVVLTPPFMCPSRSCILACSHG